MADSNSSGIDRNANHNAKIYGVTSVFTALSILAVIGRLVSCRMMKRRLQIDDFIIVLAMILQLALCILVAVGVKAWGVGKHAISLTDEDRQNFIKMVYICSLLQPCVLALVKVSILMFYRRIFVSRFMKISTTILFAVVAAWWVVVFFADALICLPPEKNWNPDMPGYCGNVRLLFIISPLPWILTDFIILLLPMRAISKLQLLQKDRIGLYGIFLLGGFACVASVVRYSTVFYANADGTWSQTGITIWSVIESSTAVISACLIVMKPVFHKLWPAQMVIYLKSFTTSSSSRSGSSSADEKSESKKALRPFRFSSPSKNSPSTSATSAAHSINGYPRDDLSRRGTEDTATAQDGGISTIGGEKNTAENDLEKIWVSREFSVEQIPRDRSS